MSILIALSLFCVNLSFVTFSVSRLMGGINVPNTPEFHDWSGGLNITYRLGPGFNRENAEK